MTDNTRSQIRRQVEDLQTEVSRGQEQVFFEQRFSGVRIENAGVQVVTRAGRDSVALSGRVFDRVEPANRVLLTEAQAVEAARRHVGKTTKVQAAPVGKPVQVILPYGEQMRWAWRLDVEAEEGVYRLWVDAADGSILQLEPQFAPSSASGLIFRPHPPQTQTQDFEVDAAVNQVYRLKLAGRLEVKNMAADGTSGDLTLNSSSASANFNVSPLNGTVVERSSQSGYNGRFQEINAYANVHWSVAWFEALGAQKFPSLTVRVNDSDACGWGINNSCANWAGNYLEFGIGQATLSQSTSAGNLFNGALDNTVVNHELAHLMTHYQFKVGGGTATWAVHEGLSDFWASAMNNTAIFGQWWGHNQATPVQDGMVPRQAEARDVFPEHRSLCTWCAESHADGQMLHWALWTSRQGMAARTTLGALGFDMSLLKALKTAGSGVVNNNTDESVHEAYLDLLEQLSAQYTSGGEVNKILAGFARAGICLSQRDAVIDIGDDYLASSAGTGPAFTVFGGRDFHFSGTTAVSGPSDFNQRFRIEAANDAQFTQNLVSSGWLTTLAVDGNGVPIATWTMPAKLWQAVHNGTALYYRVTTTDANGGNTCLSTSPGCGALVTVPPPFAVINASGAPECNYGKAVTRLGRTVVVAVLLFPIALAVIWRRRLKED